MCRELLDIIWIVEIKDCRQLAASIEGELPRLTADARDEGRNLIAICDHFRFCCAPGRPRSCSRVLRPVDELGTGAI